MNLVNSEQNSTRTSDARCPNAWLVYICVQGEFTLRAWKPFTLMAMFVTT